MRDVDTQRRRIFVDLPYELIQSLRLCQALGEANFEVCVREFDVPKFQRLREQFGLEVSAATNGISPLPRLRIRHDAPRTEVGSISRPLIFPVAILDYCKSLWSARRDITFLFSGLVTPARYDLLNGWLRFQCCASRLRTPAWTIVNRLRRRILGRKVSTQYTQDMFVGGEPFHIVSSKRGREFPIKAWDDEYFRTMARAKFVLCPRGDYPWTYRFFEAAMCGAIPLVEERCALYANFRCQDINTPSRDLTWSCDDAEHNFSVCRDLLTVPMPLLEREVQQLLRFA